MRADGSREISSATDRVERVQPVHPVPVDSDPAGWSHDDVWTAEYVDRGDVINMLVHMAVVRCLGIVPDRHLVVLQDLDSAWTRKLWRPLLLN